MSIKWAFKERTEQMLDAVFEMHSVIHGMKDLLSTKEQEELRRFLCDVVSTHKVLAQDHDIPKQVRPSRKLGWNYRYMEDKYPRLRQYIERINMHMIGIVFDL